MEQPKWRTLGIDTLLAVAAFGLSLTVLTGPADGQPSNVAWVLLIIHAGALSVRRTSPRVAFMVGLGAAAIYVAMEEPMVGLSLTPLVTVYSFAAAVPRNHAVTGLVAVQAVLFTQYLRQLSPDASTLAGNALILGLAWLVGDSVFRRRAAARTALVATADRAAVDERIRIAREMHDIVAHSMSVIVVQAGSGRMAIDDDPALAKRALTVIEDTGREALAEMRLLLGVLHADDGAPTSPIPTLAQVEHLVAESSEAGTPVDFQVEGEQKSLAPGVEVTAYRAIQEALTNVRRHAPGTTVRLRLAYDSDGVVVEVINGRPSTTPPPSEGAGRGLVGMRERIEGSGGTLEVGPTPLGGFRLLARLPERTSA